MRIKVHEVSKEFQTRNGNLSAIENISFQSEEQEFLCILGPSGCGKTTILRLVAKLLMPTKGEIIYEGISNPEVTPSAFVFQEQGVFPWMNVIDNICFGLEMHGIKKKERFSIALPLINHLGLSQFIKYYPHQLSSGMRQRVGLARALASKSEVLLMDEPFASLDAQMRQISQEKLLEVYREYRKSVIYVTHDIEEAILLADRIIVLTARPGRIKSEFKINFPRPREIAGDIMKEYAELKTLIWKQIREEVNHISG